MKFSASVICMDPVDLRSDIELLDAHGIDGYHIDVMDNSFVPRLGLYPEIVERISQITSTPIDVHLMVNDPESVIGKFSYPTVETVHFHLAGNFHNAFRIIDAIRSYGKKPSVTLNMSEPISLIKEIYGAVDSVLVLGIHPGVLGQNARPEIALEKVRELASRGKSVFVDGGVTFHSLAEFKLAGLQTAIVGSSTLFRSGRLDDRDSAVVNNLRRLRSEF